MNDKILYHNDARARRVTAATTTTAKQQILLRAVVGSLVLCAAAMGAPVSAQNCVPIQAQADASHLYDATFEITRFQTDKLCSAEIHDSPAPNARGFGIKAVVFNHMHTSANGKQLVMKLEMTREAAGNLLRKHLALP